MSPADRLRRLTAPDRNRWKPMLMGLALFAAGTGAAVGFQVPPLTEAILMASAIAAWVVGSCAMVGYVRWFFMAEASRIRREVDTAGDNLNERPRERT